MNVNNLERSQRAQFRREAKQKKTASPLAVLPVEPKPTNACPDISRLKLKQIKLEKVPYLMAVQSIGQYLEKYRTKSPFYGIARGMDIIIRSLDLVQSPELHRSEATAEQDELFIRLYMYKAISEAILHSQVAASENREQDKEGWNKVALALITHLSGGDAAQATKIYNSLIKFDENGL